MHTQIIFKTSGYKVTKNYALRYNFNPQVIAGHSFGHFMANPGSALVSVVPHATGDKTSNEQDCLSRLPELSRFLYHLLIPTNGEIYYFNHI